MHRARTDRVLTCYRIGDPDGAYPIFDAEGSRRFPGRWNTPRCPVIYTCEHYSTAILEKLVHAGGIMPANQHAIRITIPNGTSYSVFQPADHPGWDGADEVICKQAGERWREAGETALLIVPSVVARPERNIIINPRHQETATIAHELPEPVWWDARLYG